VKNPKEAAQIFVSGTRDVLRNTARSEDQKCAAKLTPADSHFLGGNSNRMKTNETDLPTYETPPQTEIRLPRPHENHKRAESDQPAPQSRPQGPLQIDCSATIRRTFSKKDRLLKRREYKRLSREGRRLVGVRLCIDCAKTSPKTSQETRLGITASTHYGNAPERNRFKRLVREAFRLGRAQIPSGVDLNVIPRKLAKTATLAEIQTEIFRLLC
jgi:ribonuclease P protein component